MSFRLAASNIAWAPSDDDAAARILRDVGFTGVEIAPTTRWESPIEASKKEIAEYRTAWKKRGLEIVALQSLLFGRNDLELFGNTIARRALKEYLTGLIELAAGLGATALVFGSPKNRKRGKMPMAEATEIAAEFFREMGAMAAAHQCAICIEPNPPSYGCDFVNTTAEAVSLVETIAGRGIKVQGDLGAILSSGAEVSADIRLAGGWLGHFHVSEPELVPIRAESPHDAVAAALRTAHYRGWVSIEMKRPQTDALQSLERAAAVVKAAYGS